MVLVPGPPPSRSLSYCFFRILIFFLLRWLWFCSSSIGWSNERKQRAIETGMLFACFSWPVFHSWITGVTYEDRKFIQVWLRNGENPGVFNLRPKNWPFFHEPPSLLFLGSNTASIDRHSVDAATVEINNNNNSNNSLAQSHIAFDFQHRGTLFSSCVELCENWNELLALIRLDASPSKIYQYLNANTTTTRHCRC